MRLTTLVRIQTEAEWLSWNEDPGELFQLVRAQVSERKLRLFACACVRQVLPLLVDERSKSALVIGELLADGLATSADVDAAGAAASASFMEAYSIHGEENHLARAAEYTLARSGLIAFAAANRVANMKGLQKQEIQERQCALFRDIVGNPFQSYTLNPDTITSIVTRLATDIYGEQSFERMPVLADALAQAGCEDQDLLLHCTGPNIHSRGCFVLDLLLGKL